MDVQIERLTFGRGDRFLLDIPSLRLRGGRVTAVLGPNGSGKTTLLRLLAGLERPTSGRIIAGNQVAYVFQEDVFLRRSVRENLELGMKLRGVPSDERRTRVADASGLLDIAHVLEQRADRLSGGEGRRASLARALCLRAPLVLLDEPLTGLDPATYTRLLDELPRLLDAFEATTVLVTHDREEALRLSDDLVVLVEGRVHAAGSKREVVTNPSDAAAAEILGYTVLETRGGGCVAVRPGSLRPGPGPVEFPLTVERVLDLVDRSEIVGWIGTTRVHIAAGGVRMMPAAGDTLVVHADQVCDVRRPDAEPLAGRLLTPP